MEVVYFSNEFPTDDLQKLFRRITNHSKDRGHPLLAQLISEITWAIKEELRWLPTSLRQSIAPFDSVLSWAECTELREGILGSSVDGVLLIVIQLAMYLGYAEHDYNNTGELPETCLAGLGIGLLASTAVSRSRNLGHLPLAGADAARLAFRLGVRVHAVSEKLEARESSGSPDSWAYVVHNVDPVAATEELELINSSKEIPRTGRVFVSAVSQTSVTISGPPTRLKGIFNKSRFFRDTKFVALPVYGGPCHAPHIYGKEDTQSIVHGSQLNASGERPRQMIPVYSTSTGRPYPAKDATQLIESVVSELLTEGIYWDRVIEGLIDRARCTLASDTVIYGFGNSIPLRDLQSALTNALPALPISNRNLIALTFQDEPRYTMPRSPAQAKLAIVGMSCRLPGGADSTDKFWDVLENALDVSRRIPADRFNVDTHYDPTGKQPNKTMTQYGCFIDNPGLFDAPFFNMSPREAQVVDPQMRLSLVTAYEALEQSGYVGNRTAATQSQRIGTYYGQAADDYREVNQGQEVSTYYIPGGCRAFGPGRINYFFKFAGPSYSIDTACSSGLAAIEVACQSLWKGEVDTAVAGGVNLLTNPDGFAGLCNGHFLTKGHNACKTWDATADGYCRADGVGSLVLKRLEDAEADNDNVLGIVLGAGTNHSAQAVSITHPHAGHQAYLSRQVLRNAGIDPLDVSYVELHGTGTQAGDKEEMEGIIDVYAPSAKRRRGDQPLHLGAVKANVGHGESVAGATALIKVLLMLQKNAIPPHIGIKTAINPNFPKDFDRRNVHIPMKMEPWPRPIGRKRIAVVNNFGAAGGNTTMLLEDAPARPVTDPDPRQSHVVAVSAKMRISLSGNIERLLAHLRENPDVSLSNLSYTTTARRSHHGFRVAIVASDAPSLSRQLSSSLEKIDSIQSVERSGSPPIAFTFTGQGASHKSMNLELYRDQTTFREHIQDLDSLARTQGFPSFMPALDGSSPKDHAHSPVVTQLALVCTEIALSKYWASLGVKPDIVVGHSLGEYAAMHVAGVITAADAIFMVGRRAQMLEEKCQAGSHTMMAVRASLVQIAESSQGRSYTIACINSASDTVLSGTKEEMDAVAIPLQVAGFRCIKLDVTFAFHSQQTDPILDDFEALAKAGVVFREPDMPVISPLLGRVVFDSKTLNANYVRRATRETVNLLSAMESAQSMSSISEETVWVEIGPHPVCTGFVKAICPSSRLAVPSFHRDEDNWKTLANSMASLHLAGVPVGWNEFHRPFERRLRLLDLPTYAWNEKKYWLQYNGDWCLTKGNTFYDAETKASAPALLTGKASTSELQTSTVHQIIDQRIEGQSGTVVVRSDLMQTDFLGAANGHRMNNCGVVTSSIHADIAYTLGTHLYRKFHHKAKNVNMEIANLVVTKGLVARSRTTSPQVIQVTAATSDISSGVVGLTWQNVDNDDLEPESFATATIRYGDAAQWLSSWTPLAHLIHSRIEALERLAEDGKANRFSCSMAYTLFAANLVDYAGKYRGMQSVVMHELEGFANVELTSKEGGVWTVPPYFIDSVAHLAGFIMNCSDAMDARNSFCVTPGWESMRFAQPLVAGNKYRSYVKMIPTTEDPSIYLGDVYVMHENVIVGMVGGIQFRRYPRVLLSRFFSPPDKASAPEGKVPIARPTDTAAIAVAPAPPARGEEHIVVTGDTSVGMIVSQDESVPSALSSNVSSTPLKAPVPAVAKTASVAVVPTGNSESIANKALMLISTEAGLELSDLEDDASFNNLGIDSLMSLVVAEKLRINLDVKVGGSLFLDYPTVGDLRKWLEEYYG
ncbi:MAG: Non-reducing polyketide synthase PKS8-1 [Chrysothrix sp. TS-e1954]|nr:MAG: Non-reducing polyketide synthase PKS8-1 [Chrysothrix sp. TS-e1954]